MACPWFPGKRQKKRAEGQYDYCLIDCMPELGNLVTASLAAADRVLIPVQPLILDVEGLASIIGTIRKIRRKINPKLEIHGVLITIADHRTNMTRDMIKAIHTSYGPHTRIYQAIVPRCTRVGESLTKSESVLRYSKQCPASVAYRALAKEVEKGERSREKHPTALDR